MRPKHLLSIGLLFLLAIFFTVKAGRRVPSLSSEVSIRTHSGVSAPAERLGRESPKRKASAPGKDITPLAARSLQSVVRTVGSTSRAQPASNNFSSTDVLPTFRPRKRRARSQPNNALPPSAEQVEQTLAVPLAFFGAADASLPSSQAAGLGQVATQFEHALAETSQDAADPAYAESFYNARQLADEQVWAVFGQDAYTALVNQRAQTAGNAPSPSP